MKTLFFFTQFLLVILLNGCEGNENENCHYSIVFSNNSDKIINVDQRAASYPDSLDRFTCCNPLDDKLSKIDAYEQNNRDALHTYRPSDGCWEVSFRYNKKPMMIYVFDNQALKSIGYSRSKYDSIVLQRYDITLEDLKKLDWKITYPPDERMKDVKMYPPYEK